jgi:hypothetical protein
MSPIPTCTGEYIGPNFVLLVALKEKNPNAFTRPLTSEVVLTVVAESTVYEDFQYTPVCPSYNLTKNCPFVLNIKSQITIRSIHTILDVERCIPKTPQRHHLAQIVIYCIIIVICPLKCT